MNDSAEQDPPMSLIAHLTELRDRLLRAVLAIVVGFVVLFPFANEIYGFVSAPLRALMPAGSTMIATGVASPFLTPFKLSLVLAIFLAIPVILFQIWGFIAPGLYQKEKRIAVPLLASSVLLFYAGAAFAYFVVFPLIFAFFTSVGPDSVQVMTDINSYLDFVLKLFLAFGIAFEMPIVAVVLIWTGTTTADSLSAKRPYLILGCFVFVRRVSTSPLENFGLFFSNVDCLYNNRNRAPDRPVSASCPFAPCRKTAPKGKKAGLRADLVAEWPYNSQKKPDLARYQPNLVHF